MFRLVEKFFRGLAFQVPQEWQHNDEQEEAEFLHVKAEVLKEVIFRNFKKGWEKEIRCEDGWIQIITECHSDLSTLDENYEIFQIKQIPPLFLYPIFRYQMIGVKTRKLLDLL